MTRFDRSRTTHNAGAVVKVAVAVATRNRPVMLQKCLNSFLKMEFPFGITVVYLVIENNEAPAMGSIVDGFSSQLAYPHSVDLLHEPKLGIPFARNCALDAATAQQCRWLIFVDDDEVVERQWLSKLLSGAESCGYDLAGGPVVPTRPEGDLTAKQTAIFKYYLSDADRKSKLRSTYLDGGKGRRIDLETNNWIARISALQKAGLRFDETMRHTGGTDTDLSRRAEKIGLKLGWIPEAVVYEVMPSDRLTLRYVFRRSRSQTLSKYHINYRKNGRRVILRPLLMAFQKTVIGFIRMGVGLVAGHRMQVKGARTLGIAVGHFESIMNRSSNFYIQTSGK